MPHGSGQRHPRQALKTQSGIKVIGVPKPRRSRPCPTPEPLFLPRDLLHTPGARWPPPPVHRRLPPPTLLPQTAHPLTILPSPADPSISPPPHFEYPTPGLPTRTAPASSIPTTETTTYSATSAGFSTRTPPNPMTASPASNPSPPPPTRPIWRELLVVVLLFWITTAEVAAPPLGSPDPAHVVGSASTNPSVSTSSSEDPPERSTGSGGKPPSEIPSKVKMKGPKRIRQPRFAFMTKSEVDNLEDGYRWRKYVKKRVERSSQDPTTAITTCEGQHCHHTVAFPRGGVMGHEFGFMGHQLSQLPPASQFMYYPTIRPREITNPINLTPTSSHQVHGLVVARVDEVEDDAVRRQKIEQATSWSFRDAGLGDEEELASARRLSCAGVEEKDMAGN
ncbi:hypothetical protein FF2_033620 [Malus domestica]